jgi:GT2 family glycosyltransferase
MSVNSTNTASSRGGLQGQPDDPYDWTSIWGATDMGPYASWYQDQLRQVLGRNAKAKAKTTIVEAGVRAGVSARIFLSALREDNEKRWHLHLIDPHPLREAMVLAKNNRRVTFHKRLAEQVAHEFEDNSIDLLHMDVDLDNTHPYELSHEILREFVPKLKSDAVVLFHDSTDHFPGIKRIVTDLKDSDWDVEFCEPASLCPIAAPAVARRVDGLTRIAPLTMSVVIPVICNKWLDALLNNIAEQTVKPAEIIVVDNGVRCVERLCERARNKLSLPITYLLQEKNIGVNASWNLGISTAKTDLLSILNDDIVIPPRFFEMVRRTFYQHPGAGFVIPSTIGPPLPPGGGRAAPWVVGVPEDILDTEEAPQVKEIHFRDGGWAMTIKRGIVPEIPDSMFTFCGDDFLFTKYKQMGMDALKVTNLSIFHYIGISFDVEQRETLGLPNIEKDRRAWRKIKATDGIVVNKQSKSDSELPELKPNGKRRNRRMLQTEAMIT